MFLLIYEKDFKGVENCIQLVCEFHHPTSSDSLRSSGSAPLLAGGEILTTALRNTENNLIVAASETMLQAW
jgi:hypothetical protein